jgi:hypothetical protein
VSLRDGRIDCADMSLSNGTAPYCLSEVLNSTQTTNSKDFFNNLLTGTNVNWYSQSFFQQPASRSHWSLGQEC